MLTLRWTLLLSAGLCAQAANWPHWRGPEFNGSSPERNLPADWSTSNRLAWAVDLPGPSAATPILWNDHVFVSSTDPRAGTLLAMAFDRASGRPLWQHKVADGIRRDNRSTYASSSPVTDGQRVIFFYSTGDTVAFDFSGKSLWARNLQKEFGEFAFLWTFSSSPTLDGGRLFLQVLQRDVAVSGRGRSDGPNDSYLIALDPATGATLWRQVRPSEAVAESREAFSTPIPARFEGRAELLVMGGDCLTSHDPATGRELWRWGTWNPSRVGHWRLVPSPVAGNGIVLVCAPKQEPVVAIKAGGSGLLGEGAVVWTSRERREVTSDVPTPLFMEGDFFVLSDLRKCLSRIDPKTGKVKWSVPTPGRSKYEASPTGADGKVYLMNFQGEVTVMSAANGEVLKTIPMGEPGDDMIRSSIAVGHGQLLIRTNRKLFCVGPGASAGR